MQLVIGNAGCLDRGRVTETKKRSASRSVPESSQAQSLALHQTNSSDEQVDNLECDYS